MSTDTESLAKLRESYLHVIAEANRLHAASTEAYEAERWRIVGVCGQRRVQVIDAEIAAEIAELEECEHHETEPEYV